MAQQARSTSMFPILLIGILAAAALFYLSALYFKQEAHRAAMDSMAGKVSAFQGSLQAIGEQLDILSDHLAAVESVSPENFATVAGTLALRPPVAEAIGLARLVPAGEYGNFLQEMRQSYTRPLSGMVPSPDTVTSTGYRFAYLAPRTAQEIYLARDPAASAPLAEALGRAQSSGRITAAQGWPASADGGESPGQWSFFLPVSGKGMLAGLYDVSAMAQAAFGRGQAGDGVAVSLYARPGSVWLPVFQQGDAPDEPTARQNEFSSSVSLYGTEWRVLAQARPEMPLYAYWQAWAVAAIPFLMSLLFIALSPAFAPPAPAVKKTSGAGRKKPAPSMAEGGASHSSHIIGQMVDGIVTMDTDGIIQSANPATLKMFGYDEERDLVGENVTILMGEPYRSSHNDYVQRYLKSGQARILGEKREVKAQRKSGAEFPIEIAVSEVEIEGQRLFTATMRDITDRKRVDMLKSEFISTVSHELRTPLTSIRGSLGLVINSMTEEIPDKAVKLLRVAYQNSERLSSLVNDILDMERLDAEQVDYTFEPVNINTLAQSAIEANEAYANQYDVKLVAHPFHKPLFVSGDFERLMQLMNNLISNACKFSPKGGTVNIWFDRVDGNVRLTVQDEGEGIAPEFQPKLFERFTQADASDTRSKGGTGLGLYIVKKIVERHGGEISFESHQGRGTKFFVDLPRIEEGEDAEAPASQPGAKQPQPQTAASQDQPLQDRPVPAQAAPADQKAAGKPAGDDAPEAAKDDKQAPQAKTDEDRKQPPDKEDKGREVASADQAKPAPSEEKKKQPKAEIIKQESAAAKKEAARKAIEQRRKEMAEKEKEAREKARKAKEKRRAEQEAKARAEAEKKKKERTRPRVLICENDPDIVDFMKPVLKEEGFLVEVARTAQEGFKRATTEHFDAIAVDLILPDRDGISLIRALRRSARAADLEVIVLSKRAKEGIEKLGAGALGVRAWLKKPLTKDALRDAFQGIEATAGEPEHTILLLDTSKTAEENLQQLLSGTAEVERATSIGAARGLMKENNFRLIVCDPDTIDEDLGDLVDLAKEASLPLIAYTAADLKDADGKKFTAVYGKSVSDLEALCEKAFSLLKDDKNETRKKDSAEAIMSDA